MNSEFVAQLENKMFIIGSFLGFFSWRLLLAAVSLYFSEIY